MPIVRQWNAFNDCHLLIWEITESLQALKKSLIVHSDEWAEFDTISHPQKQLEWLSGRCAMQALVKSHSYDYQGMIKDEYGKPFLRNRIAEISLTHTTQYIVVALSFSPVGVDLERITPQIARVAPKFLSEAERQTTDNSLESLSTYWCAKEALYKLHGKRQLSFKNQIFVDAFTATSTFLSATIHPVHHLPTTHTLQRFWVEDFCGVVAV